MHKIQKYLMMGLVGLSILSCKKFADSTETIKLEENEKAIQNYMSSNKLTASSIGQGVYMKVNKVNDTGRIPKTGDLISAHYVIYKLDGTKVDSTSTINNKPARFPLGYTDINILQIGASKLKQGESATFLVPYTLGFGEKEVGSVPAYSPLRIEISIANIQDEVEQVTAYMKENNYSATVTSSGLQYHILVEKPGAAQVKDGQSVTVKYVGKLLYYSSIAGSDGKLTNVFDSGTISNYKMGSKGLIAGFEEGLSKLKVGEKAILCFPSNIGYGDTGSKGNTGYYTILPKAPLAFEVEIVSAQ